MRYSLLLAEDDAGLRELIVRGLREEGFEIEAVAGGFSTSAFRTPTAATCARRCAIAATRFPSCS
jgi:DNA-binding response OmpR family regulator